MFGLRKKVDWEAKYAEKSAYVADLQSARDTLRSELDARDAWITAMCAEWPRLKIRVDRCQEAYDRVTALVAEAEEHGWTTKEL